MMFRSLLLLLCLAGCQAPEQPTPILAKAEIRFLEGQQSLRGDLSLYRGDSLRNSETYHPPEGTVAFLGSAMQATELGTQQRWRAEQRTAWPGELRFSFPVAEDRPTERFILPVAMSAPQVDSLPRRIDKRSGLRFAVGTVPLREDENVVLFFEPEARSAEPRRILIAGPTKTERVFVPNTALTDLPVGNYGVYLIKQQLARDTIEYLYAATQIGYHTRSVTVEVTETD